MKYVVGIDEVGRGPLAGPVTVCAVLCERKVYSKLKLLKSLPKAGKDSKKLNEKEREIHNEALLKLAKQRKIAHVVTHISSKVIDTKGISYAIRSALGTSLARLNVLPHETEVLLDGGLRAPEVYVQQRTIVKGDEKEKIIAWASILAKVSRDSRMRRLSKKLPHYGFEVNKGYGTRSHRDALRKLGLSPAHRRSFCKRLTL